MIFSPSQLIHTGQIPHLLSVAGPRMNLFCLVVTNEHCYFAARTGVVCVKHVVGEAHIVSESFIPGTVRGFWIFVVVLF